MLLGERIRRSDSLIPSGLQDQLIAMVSPLENVPDAENDWHPRSNNQVLSLVHPSVPPSDRLQCTFVKAPQTGKCQVLRPPGHRNYSVSQKFHWLPSDFAVAEDCTITLVSPYINIHPQKHPALESVIPKLLERAVSLWERVLSDM